MRCLTSSISILLLAIFILLTNPENINLQLISFVYSFVLLFRSFDLFDYFYQSKLLSKISSVISVIGYIIASIYRVFLLLNKSDVVWFAIAYVLDMFIVSLLFLIMYKKNGGELFFNMQIAKSLLSKSYHYILSTFMYKAEISLLSSSSLSVSALFILPSSEASPITVATI